MCFFFLLLNHLSVRPTKRSVSQENTFKKNKNPSALFHKPMVQIIPLYIPIENNFRSLMIAKFVFKVTVHSTHWPTGGGTPSCDPFRGKEMNLTKLYGQ